MCFKQSVLIIAGSGYISCESVRACGLAGLASAASTPGAPPAAPPLPRDHFLQLLAVLHDLTLRDHAVYEAVVLAGE